MSELAGIESLTQSQLSDNSRKIFDALVRKNSDLRPALQLRIPIALDNAQVATNPLKIGGPFSGFYIETAGTTDSSTNVLMSFSSPEQVNLINYTTVKYGDAASFDEPVREVFLTWAAQPGKVLTLIAYLGVDFKPGSSIVQLSGGISLAYGSGMTPIAAVNVTAAATQIFAANSARKKQTIVNCGQNTVWISGTNAVVSGTAPVAGAFIGIPVAPGGIFEWENSGACFGICDLGQTSIVAINSET